MSNKREEEQKDEQKKSYAVITLKNKELEQLKAEIKQLKADLTQEKTQRKDENTQTIEYVNALEHQIKELEEPKNNKNTSIKPK